MDYHSALRHTGILWGLTMPAQQLGLLLQLTWPHMGTHCSTLGSTSALGIRACPSLKLHYRLILRFAFCLITPLLLIHSTLPPLLHSPQFLLLPVSLSLATFTSILMALSAAPTPPTHLRLLLSTRPRRTPTPVPTHALSSASSPPLLRISCPHISRSLLPPAHRRYMLHFSP